MDSLWKKQSLLTDQINHNIAICLVIILIGNDKTVNKEMPEVVSFIKVNLFIIMIISFFYFGSLGGLFNSGHDSRQGQAPTITKTSQIFSSGSGSSITHRRFGGLSLFPVRS